MSEAFKVFGIVSSCLILIQFSCAYGSTSSSIPSGYSLSNSTSYPKMMMAFEPRDVGGGGVINAGGFSNGYDKGLGTSGGGASAGGYYYYGVPSHPIMPNPTVYKYPKMGWGLAEKQDDGSDGDFGGTELLGLLGLLGLKGLKGIPLLLAPFLPILLPLALPLLLPLLLLPLALLLLPILLLLFLPVPVLAVPGGRKLIEDNSTGDFINIRNDLKSKLEKIITVLSKDLVQIVKKIEARGGTNLRDSFSSSPSTATSRNGSSVEAKATSAKKSLNNIPKKMP